MLVGNGEKHILLEDALRFIEPPLLGRIRNEIERYHKDDPEALDAVLVIEQFAAETYDEDDRREFVRGG